MLVKWSRSVALYIMQPESLLLGNSLILWKRWHLSIYKLMHAACKYTDRQTHARTHACMHIALQHTLHSVLSPRLITQLVLGLEFFENLE